MNYKALVALSTMALSVSAFAQSSGSMSGGGTTGSSATSGSNTTGATTNTGSNQNQTADMTPKDICNKMVELTKNSDQNAVKTEMQRWTLMGGEKHHGGKWAHQQGKMGGQQDWLKREISNADCGSETVAGNHAFVVTKSGEMQRLIPFVKQGTSWKFDLQAYRTLYRMDSRTPASQQ